MRASWPHWAPCAALLLALGACGYRPLPRVGAMLPAGCLQVVPFAEVSSVGLSGPLAQSLCRRLAADGIDLPLTAPAGQRLPQLTGSLQTRTFPSASRAGVAAYAIEATVSVVLRGADGALLRQGSVVVQEDFLPQPELDSQPLLTERHRRFALARLAERAAGAVHRLLQQDAA